LSDEWEGTQQILRINWS